MYGPNLEKLNDMVIRFLHLSPKRKLKLHILSKLLVLAERKAIMETSTPILGAKFYNAPKGPEFTDLLGYICTNFCCIRPMGKEEDLDTYFILFPGQYWLKDALSEYEIEILEQIWENYGGIKKWDMEILQDIFHEWERPSVPVPLKVVLREGLHYYEAEARAKLREIEYFQGLENADYS